MFEEDKTDRVDAYRIADFLRLDIHQNSLIKEEQYIALQRLTRSRYQLVTQLTECKQHFIENLYYKCNTLTQSIDTSVFGSTMMALLTEDVTLDEVADMPLEDLADFLNTKGRDRFADSEKLAKSIQKAIRSAYRLGQVVADSVDQVLGTYAMLIKTYTSRLKHLRKALSVSWRRFLKRSAYSAFPALPAYTRRESSLRSDRSNALKTRRSWLNMPACTGRKTNPAPLLLRIPPSLNRATIIFDIT